MKARRSLAGAVKSLDATDQGPVADPIRQNANVAAKAWAHAFLASRPQPDRRVGEAAKSGYWPFDAPAFAQLLALLKGI